MMTSSLAREAANFFQLPRRIFDKSYMLTGSQFISLNELFATGNEVEIENLLTLKRNIHRRDFVHNIVYDGILDSKLLFIDLKMPLIYVDNRSKELKNYNLKRLYVMPRASSIEELSSKFECELELPPDSVEFTKGDGSLVTEMS